MKRLFWFALLALALGLAWWGIARALVPTVASTGVKLGNVILLVPGSASVSAESESQLTSPGSGLIQPEGYALKVGDHVAAGQLLAKIDPGDLPSLRDQANLKYEEDATLLSQDNASHGSLASEIMLQVMKDNLEFKKKELENKIIGQADLDEYTQQVAAQQATATRDRLDLETDQKIQKDLRDSFDAQIKRLEIRAPYDGYITAVNAHPGDLRTTGDNIAYIISSQLKIQAEVNQDDIAAVREGARAEIHFVAYTDKIQAIVKRVLPSSDKATQRFTVLLELSSLSTQVADGRTPNDGPQASPTPGPPIQLMAGLTGEVSFIAGEHDNVLTIPRRALFGNSVFVVKDGRVEIRQVKPGYITLTRVDLGDPHNPAQTIHEGEIVLTENLDLFRTGDRVRLAPEVKSASPPKP
jgi:multidrug efflux pump subunit AcrA (membrane-fusion protein)